MGIPCGPVNSIDQVACDPQVASREMIIDVHHAKAGNFKVVNTPVKVSRSKSRPEQASPDLGEHTEDVLKGLLGMTEQDIERLRKQRVV